MSTQQQQTTKHLINPQLQAMAIKALYGKQAAARVASINILDLDAYKQAFVPADGMGGDPSGGTGGGAGGAPAAAAGGDPAMAAGGGGAPPAVDPNAIAQQVLSQVQSQQGAMGGMPGMVEPIKPKIDVNVEIMQIKKMLAKLCDANGVVIPASDMAVNSQDLTQMAMQQGGQGGGAGGGGSQQQQSAISPIGAMGAAAPGMAGGAGAGGGGAGMGKVSGFNNGSGFDTAGLGNLGSRAAAIMHVRRSAMVRRPAGR